MTLREYAKHIIAMLQNNPELADLPMVYAELEEQFWGISHPPVAGYLNDNEYFTEDDEDNDDFVINAVRVGH